MTGLLAQLKCVAKFVLQLALGDANLLHRRGVWRWRLQGGTWSCFPFGNSVWNCNQSRNSLRFHLSCKFKPSNFLFVRLERDPWGALPILRKDPKVRCVWHQVSCHFRAHSESYRSFPTLSKLPKGFEKQTKCTGFRMASFQKLPDRFDPWFVCLFVCLYANGGIPMPFWRLEPSMWHYGAHRPGLGPVLQSVAGPKSWIRGIGIGWIKEFPVQILWIQSFPWESHLDQERRAFFLRRVNLRAKKKPGNAWQRILAKKKITIFIFIFTVYMYI